MATKLNRPLIIKGEPIYPLVSIDQIIKTDGSRLEDENGKINADMLNNKLENELSVANSQKLNNLTLTNLIDKIYPVGSIYMSVNNVTPATLFGGTWEQIKDKFLLSAGDTYSAGSTGGEATHTLTIPEMPAHQHAFARQQWYSADTVANSSTGSIFSWKSGTGTGGSTSASYRGTGTDGNGGDQPHNNMPPYLAVYVWKRTA